MDTLAFNKHFSPKLMEECGESDEEDAGSFFDSAEDKTALCTYCQIKWQVVKKLVVQVHGTVRHRS